MQGIYVAVLLALGVVGTASSLGVYLEYKNTKASKIDVCGMTEPNDSENPAPMLLEARFLKRQK